MSVSLLRLLVRCYPFRRGRTRVTKFVKRKLDGIRICSDNLGNRFLLDLDNFIDSEIYLSGSFEEKVVTIFAESAIRHNCHIFIDVGANLGFYTIFFASQTTIEKVYAFEPDPRNFAQLEGNVFLNRLYDKIIAHNMGLSSKNGEETLYLSRMRKDYENNKLNTGTSSIIFNEERHSRQKAIKIQTRRLDDLLKIENESVAVKIDVEGHEATVLEGMRTFLKNNNCTILVESLGVCFDAVDRYLGDLGYRMSKLLKLPDYNYIYSKDND